MITNLILDGTNILSTFEFQSCLFGTIELFDFEIRMYRNLSFY